MNSTALGATNKESGILFISEAHEKFYYDQLQKVQEQDEYHKALCYCLGISNDTRRNQNTTQASQSTTQGTIQASQSTTQGTIQASQSTTQGTIQASQSTTQVIISGKERMILSLLKHNSHMSQKEMAEVLEWRLNLNAAAMVLNQILMRLFALF